MNNKWIDRINWTAAGLVAILAVFAFVLSYSSLQHMAATNGVGAKLSYIWPLLLDFAMLVFSLSILRANLRQESSWYAWSLTIAFASLAVIGNIFDVSTLGLSTVIVKSGVKAIAPIALVLSFELLMSMIRAEVKRAAVVTSIANLTREFDILTDEVDKLTVKRNKLQAELSELQRIKNVSETTTLTQVNQARSAERKARLDALVNILTQEPDTSVSTLAERLRVSRTTVYNDLGMLVETGRIRRNGQGVKVHEGGDR